MTLPEFLDALQAIAKVRDELRPKTMEELTAMMGQEIAAQQARNLAEKRRNQGARG